MFYHLFDNLYLNYFNFSLHLKKVVADSPIYTYIFVYVQGVFRHTKKLNSLNAD